MRFTVSFTCNGSNTRIPKNFHFFPKKKKNSNLKIFEKKFKKIFYFFWKNFLSVLPPIPSPQEKFFPQIPNTVFPQFSVKKMDSELLQSFVRVGLSEDTTDGNSHPATKSTVPKRRPNVTIEQKKPRKTRDLFDEQYTDKDRAAACSFGLTVRHFCYSIEQSLNQFPVFA